MTDKYMSEPIIVEWKEQPYAAIPIEATLLEWDQVHALVGELFQWVEQHDLSVTGAPFYRYWVIGGIKEVYQLEVGLPVERMVKGDERIIGSVIPGGSYIKAEHNGHPDRLDYSLEALLRWAEMQGLSLDKRYEGETEIWNGRFEFYGNDPELEPDLDKWKIEIACLILRDRVA